MCEVKPRWVVVGHLHSDGEVRAGEGEVQPTEDNGRVAAGDKGPEDHSRPAVNADQCPDPSCLLADSPARTTYHMANTIANRSKTFH